MLLDPPGRHQLYQRNPPHWPYLKAVDQALAQRGIPPGIVRADIDLRPTCEPGRRDRIYVFLIWDVSRTGARGGVKLAWDDGTGWSYAKLGAKTDTVLLQAPGHTTASRLRRPQPSRSELGSEYRSLSSAATKMAISAG